MKSHGWIAGIMLLLGSSLLLADDPCVSGLQSGQRTGPYSAVMCTGPNRGISHCYVCETADLPAVIVFARSLSDGLAKLTLEIDKALLSQKDADLRAWVTLLHDDQSAVDQKVVQWSKKNAIRNVPIGVFEDAQGPPSYRLAREADVTVLLCAGQKVAVNFAYRTGELTEQQVARIAKDIPQLRKKK